jgi:hypothetical protein
MDFRFGPKDAIEIDEKHRWYCNLSPDTRKRLTRKVKSVTVQTRFFDVQVGTATVSRQVIDLIRLPFMKAWRPFVMQDGVPTVALDYIGSELGDPDVLEAMSKREYWYGCRAALQRL